MKFTQTIVALVTSLGFINIAFTTPLTLKTGFKELIPGRDIASAEDNLPKRQSKQELQNILRNMDCVISNLGAQTREEFTNELIDQLFNNNGHYNYVVCHFAHDYNFQGTEGVDWAHYQTKFHKYDYDIVIGNAGEFTVYGDGSPINLAYSTPYVLAAKIAADGVTTVVFAEAS